MQNGSTLAKINGNDNLGPTTTTVAVTTDKGDLYSQTHSLNVTYNEYFLRSLFHHWLSLKFILRQYVSTWFEQRSVLKVHSQRTGFGTR